MKTEIHILANIVKKTFFIYKFLIFKVLGRSVFFIFFVLWQALVNFINILRPAFVTILFRQKLQSQIVIREKLLTALLYKNGTHKMLMKLTQGLVWSVSVFGDIPK